MTACLKAVHDPDCAVKQEVVLEVAPKTACRISVSFLGPGLGMRQIFPRLDTQFVASRPFVYDEGDKADLSHCTYSIGAAMVSPRMAAFNSSLALEAFFPTFCF
jgi:hypothetical protein